MEVIGIVCDAVDAWKMQRNIVDVGGVEEVENDPLASSAYPRGSDSDAISCCPSRKYPVSSFFSSVQVVGSVGYSAKDVWCIP
jgi:hypothetical protein